jgi:hypothetical protein
VAPALNDLYCYFCQLGRWKELSPPEIDSRKRELDKNMHVYEALLTHGVIEAYDRFMRDAFQTFIMPGADGAAPKGNRSEAFRDEWETKWDDMFAEDGLSSDDLEKKTFSLGMCC